LVGLNTRKKRKINFRPCLTNIWSYLYLFWTPKLAWSEGSGLRYLVGLRQTQLISPEIIRTLVFRILKVFEDVSQIELSKGRWEEIKKLKLQPALT